MLLEAHGLPYNGSGDPSGAQTERRGGAGPVGGLLGGKGPTGRLVCGAAVSHQPSPRPLAVRPLILVLARGDRTPLAGSLSEITARDHFPAGAGAQGLQC